MEEENQELSLSLSLSQSLNISSKSPSMAEPSKAEDQNPHEKDPETSIDKPLTLEECSKTNSFSFQVYPAFKLRRAIYALSDSEFNKQGTAMIEVGPNAVELTVWNTETNVLGYLRLNVKGLIEFDFRKPLRRKMINLNHIYQTLELASDMDTVTISHVDDSNNLSFNFGNLGTEPFIKFKELLLDIDDEFEKAPDIVFSCECILLNEYLWHLLGLIEATNTKLVSLELTDSSVTIFVGENVVHYEYDTKKGGTRGMEEGQRHHAWFQWPNCDVLIKASLLTKGVLLCLVTDPNDSIMWRFNLQDLGDLAFVKKNAILKFIPNFEPGTNEEGDSSTA